MEHKKTEKYQELKDQLEQMLKVKTKKVPVVKGALGAVPPNWERSSSRFQVQHQCLCRTLEFKLW